MSEDSCWNSGLRVGENRAQHEGRINIDSPSFCYTHTHIVDVNHCAAPCPPPAPFINLLFMRKWSRFQMMSLTALASFIHVATKSHSTDALSSVWSKYTRGFGGGLWDFTWSQDWEVGGYLPLKCLQELKVLNSFHVFWLDLPPLLKDSVSFIVYSVHSHRCQVHDRGAMFPLENSCIYRGGDACWTITRVPGWGRDEVGAAVRRDSVQ